MTPPRALVAAQDAARTLGALGALTAALPVSLIATTAALLRPARPPAEAADGPRLTVLLSGGKMTKSLALARAFARAGHRVVLVETARYRWTGHRASRAVDRFHVVPAPIDPGYAEALLRVVQREQVDVYVPVSSPVASRHDARAKPLLSPHCEVLTMDADLVDVLDDKHRFVELAGRLGLDVPRSYLVTSPAQVAEVDVADAPHGYLLKRIAYDPAGRLRPLHLTGADPECERALVARLPIAPEDPWVLQEYLHGQEYCTHSTVRGGRVQVWVCCPSSASQLTYETADVPAVRQWVTRFVGALGLTGQVAFDFIVTDGGRALPIECNPRTHSAITLFHSTPGLADAYLNERDEPLEPVLGSRPTYWLHHELGQLLRHPSTWRTRVARLAHGTDAVLDGRDPLPFLLLHHRQLPALLLQNLRAGRRWLRIDLNIGKLVEPGGD